MHFKRQNLIHTVVYEGTPLTFRSGIPTPASLRGGGIGLLRLGLGGGAGLLLSCFCETAPFGMEAKEEDDIVTCLVVLTVRVSLVEDFSRVAVPPFR